MNANSDNVDEYGDEVGGDHQMRKGGNNNRRPTGAEASGGRYKGMLGYDNQHQLADSGPIVDEDVEEEDMDQEMDL